MEPYIPYYNRDGNKVVSRETRPFEDRAGNKAILKIVHYENKKGEMLEAVHCVKWLDPLMVR